MQPSLYKEPYEKGRVEGQVRMVIKLVTKRFGVIPSELRKKIELWMKLSHMKILGMWKKCFNKWGVGK